MKIYYAKYSDPDEDTFEDVLVAKIDSAEEQELYEQHCKMDAEIEWLNRRLSEFDLNDDDIFFYFMNDEAIGEGNEIENLCIDGDMIVIGEEF